MGNKKDKSKKKLAEEDCWKPEKHPRHMCKLYKKGLMMEYDEQAKNPTVKCAKCGAEANQPEAVCQPKPR